MGIPECILTVTTRITKYPLLIEPLIKTAKDRPAEQQKLRSCLSLVKSILIDVNGQVTFLSAFLQCDFFRYLILPFSFSPELFIHQKCCCNVTWCAAYQL